MKRKNLQLARTQQGKTQTEIATLLGVTTRHYQALEAGTSQGSVEVWERLRDLLGAPSIDYLLAQGPIEKEPDESGGDQQR